MALTSRMTEISTVVGFIAANSGATGSSPWLSDAISLDCDTARRLVAYINVGTLGGSSTVDAKFQYATASGGSYSDITNTAMTQDTTGSRVDQIEAMVENIYNNYPTAKWVKLRVAIGTAATPFSATIVGYDPAHVPIAVGTDVGTTTTYP
jgi:hypothetical protein